MGDIRYGARVLRKNPLFTAIAIGSLALAIGANTAVFTLVKAMLLEKLPVEAPDELVITQWHAGGLRNVITTNSRRVTDPDTGLDYYDVFHYGAFVRFREQSEHLAAVFGYATMRRAAMYSHGRTDLVQGMLVSGDYYKGLGVQPLMGRLLNETDDHPGAEPAAVISYQLWRDSFGSDPKTVGTAITLNSVPLTIIGVTPPSYYGISRGGYNGPPDVTVPFALAPHVEPGLSGIDRLLLQRTDLWWVCVMDGCARRDPAGRAGRVERDLSPGNRGNRHRGGGGSQAILIAPLSGSPGSGQSPCLLLPSAMDVVRGGRSRVAAGLRQRGHAVVVAWRGTER